VDNDVAGIICQALGEDWLRICTWPPDGKRLASTEINCDDMKCYGIWPSSSASANDGDEDFAAVVAADAADDDDEGEVDGGDRYDTVYACAWSPDGARFASASSSNMVRVWQAPAMTTHMPTHDHDHADVANIPGSSLEVGIAHLRSWADGWGLHSSRYQLNLSPLVSLTD
jgi:WD40 repeat protein